MRTLDHINVRKHVFDKLVDIIHLYFIVEILMLIKITLRACDKKNYRKL